MKSFLIIIFIWFSFILEANQLNTSSGIIAPEKLEKGLRWNDIPYALPPVGELRWKAPRSFQSPDAMGRGRCPHNVGSLFCGPS